MLASDIFRPVDFEDLALIVRQLVDKLVAEGIEKEKRTIDVRVVQEVEQRLPIELTRSLKKDHRYQALQRHRHRQQLKKEHLMQLKTARFRASLTWLATGSKSNLSWLGSWFWSGARMGWCFFGYLALFLTLGAALGVNIPQVIYCKERNGFCYLAKWDKSAVVLPSNEKKLLQKYLKLYRRR